MIWLPLAFVAWGVNLGVDLVRMPAHPPHVVIDVLMILALLLVQTSGSSGKKERP